MIFPARRSAASGVIVHVRICIVLTVLLVIQHSAFGQMDDISFYEKHAFARRQMPVESAASSWFDVAYYMLDLNIISQPNYLQGKVTIAGTCQQNNSSMLTLDLMNTMAVDSVLVNGVRTTVVQTKKWFDITLDRPYQSGDRLSVNVYYQGRPVASGFGSFVFDVHTGVPWIYTLSEPFGASDWWPCKNTPGDKADSADIFVTCDSTYKVGSQGMLVSTVNHGNGRSTWHWKERYPIASYLISVAMTDYVQFSNWYRYSSADSMEVLNYVLPEHYDEAVQILPLTIDMLSIFSDLFGLYPFIKEKYGHAEFAGGGMEHQTMTSLGRYDEEIIAHELAHQWFGDMITCRTWSDLWLNEGFAQYSTALYRERKYGVQSYWEYMVPQLQRGMLAQGVIGSPDTTSPATLFNSLLVYSKAASTLHTLRHVLGDSIFFRSMHAYANDPQLKYSTAVTKDFQTVCEKVSNKDLDYFFQEWIYGQGIPSYEYSWSWESSVLTIDVRQPSGRTKPDYFIMPIDFRIRGSGKDTTVKVFNNAREQTFSLNFPMQPSSVLLDPDGWIMKRVFSGSGVRTSNITLEQNFPNPFSASTKIRYILPGTAPVTLKIYDVLGRDIATLVDEKQIPGMYEAQWSPRSAASGIYFYRLAAGNVQRVKKMAVIR